MSPGLEKEVLDKLKNHIPKEASNQLVSLLSRIDGQNDFTFLFLPDQVVLYSMNDIIEEYLQQQKYMDDDADEFYNEYQDDERVRSLIFHPSRIPIAWQEGLGYISVDLDPGPNGRIGQLIYNINECDFIVLANSIDDLFTKINECIESKQLHFVKEKEGFPNKYRLRGVDENIEMTGENYLEILNKQNTTNNKEQI